MTNSVIRHLGTDRRSVPHSVTSSRCRTTMDLDLVTCDECHAAIQAAQEPDVAAAPVAADATQRERDAAHRAVVSRQKARALLAISSVPPDVVRVYLPETFIRDARECDYKLEGLWRRIESAPRVRRGAGWGRWAELTRDEANSIAGEALYRAEYWLSDLYGVESVTASERAAGRAAIRVLEAIEAITNGKESDS